MKLSFTTLGCPDWTLPQIAEKAKAYGYDGIELRTNADGNHLSPDAPPEEARGVAELFRAQGVPVNSLMGYTRFAYLDGAEVAKNQALMRKLIGLAETMRVPFIRSFAGGIPKGATFDQMVETVGRALRPLATEAASKGITIALETHDDWCAGRSIKRVMEITGSRGFGIVYDIYNAFHSGIETWDETYRQVKDHICYCHLKDGYQGLDGKACYVLVGAGDLPIEKILGRLKADGYNGFLSFEWEKKWHPELEPPERAFPHFPHKVRALWAAAGAPKPATKKKSAPAKARRKPAKPKARRPAAKKSKKRGRK